MRTLILFFKTFSLGILLVTTFGSVVAFADTDTDTVDTDTDSLDTDDTDTGDTDTGDTDTGDTDTGETDTGDTDTGDSDTSVSVTNTAAERAGEVGGFQCNTTGSSNPLFLLYLLPFGFMVRRRHRNN